MKNDMQYAYAVGRIRALEKRLLDKSSFDRMLEARTPGEALRILTETEYGGSLEDPSKAENYEHMLDRELARIYRLMKEISPEPEIFRLFLYKYDVHNLKVLLKAEFSGNDPSSFLVDSGTVPVPALVSAVRERDYKILPLLLRKSVENTVELFNRSRDPQDIDMELDRGLFKQLLKTAEESGSNFLTEYVKVQIDLVNILSFLRLKRLQNAWNLAPRTILEGGTIPVSLLISCLNEGLEIFISRLQNSPYGALVEAGTADWKQTGGMTRLEKLCDEFLLKYVKKGRYMAFGVEPLAGYLVVKESEIRNVRIILVGKFNGIPPETIRERVRDMHA